MAELKIKADSGGGTVSLKGPATTTSNAAVQLTLPVDDGDANQYLKTDGSGALSWATVSGTTINNSADNRVITGSGTANTLEAESKLTFDGSVLRLENTTASGDGVVYVEGGEGASAVIEMVADEGDDNADKWKLYSNASDNEFKIASKTSGSYVDKLNLETGGNVKIVDGDLKIATAGHGIDFSATSDYTNKDDEVLADYETGYFTPTTINSITLVSTENRLWYVKVGHQVTISGSLQVDDGQSSAKLQLSGLPFSHGTIGGNGTQVSNSAFFPWGWDTQPTYSSDDKAFWVTITGTSMNLHVRTSNGDWHYFYPSDTTWLLFNFSYYTDS